MKQIPSPNRVETPSRDCAFCIDDVLSLLAEGKSLSTEEIAEKLNASRRKVEAILGMLALGGLVDCFRAHRIGMDPEKLWFERENVRKFWKLIQQMERKEELEPKT